MTAVVSSIFCDDCGQHFLPSLQTRREADGTFLTFFTCPNCSREYPVLHTTERGHQVRTELVEVVRAIRVATATNDVAGKQALIARWSTLREEMEAETMPLTGR